MPTLQVRELPEELYGALKREAQREHRSLAQQAVVVLARGLNREQSSRDRRQRLLDTLAAPPLLPPGKRLPPIITYVREDRRR